MQFSREKKDLFKGVSRSNRHGAACATAPRARLGTPSARLHPPVVPRLQRA